MFLASTWPAGNGPAAGGPMDSLMKPPENKARLQTMLKELANRGVRFDVCLARSMVRRLAHVRAPSRGVYLAEQAWRPRPCVTRTGGPGRPGFPSALTMKGCLRKEAGTVRMKGGESRPDRGGRKSPGPDPTRRSRGGRRHSGAPGGGVPQTARGTARCQTEDGAPNGAPLPHICEGRGKRRRRPSAEVERGR